MISKKAQMRHIIGGMIIAAIIIIVSIYVYITFFSGFLSPEENTKITAMNLAEEIRTRTAFGAGLGCGEIDVAVFPEYQIFADIDEGQIEVLHEYKNDEGEKRLKIWEYGSKKDVFICSPTGFDSSVHTTHCPSSLIINRNYDDKIIGRYCVCPAPEGFEIDMLVYPKKLGSLTCVNLIGEGAEGLAEAGIEAGENKVYDYSERLKDLYEDDEIEVVEEE